MNVAVRNAEPQTDRETQGQIRLDYVDCDVHPYYKSAAEFDQFLSERWQRHRRTIGVRPRQGLSKNAAYPRMSPGTGMRMDAWTAAGDHPGSDLPLMQKQLLDLFGAAYGIMLPL